MLNASTHLAKRIERAEIDFCAAAVGPDRIASLEAGGGRALFSVAGSPLNKVLGLGVGAPVSDADLDAIEAFYRAHKAHVRVELCPLAQFDLPGRLSARGYQLQEFENELGRTLPLTDDELRSFSEALPPEPEVTLTMIDEDAAWVRAVAEGFAVADGDSVAPPEAVEQFSEIMQLFVQPPINRYIIRTDGEVAGGGATFLQDRLLGIFGTATVPRFRRRGVQTAMVMHALAGMREEADIAIATTQPGTTSQRTFERLGFQVLYTRAIMVLPLHDPPHGARGSTRN